MKIEGICLKCGSEVKDGVCKACEDSLKPFYRKNLKNEGEDKLLLTIRLNPEERALLDEIKGVLDLTSDGGALKLCCFRGWLVLQQTLGRENLNWLCDKNRQTRGLK